MPGFVTSTEVVPPRRTENSGISLSRMALIFLRLAKSASIFSFHLMGPADLNAE